MKQDIEKLLPLSPAILHILLSLAGDERHGYGIMQDIARQSNGRYKLGPGTLYDNLQRLLKEKLVEEVEGYSSGDSRRRYYRLTNLGRRVLSAEIIRLESAIREAKLHLGIPRRAS
jgi:DNA-binding PadR family transcriptional regulator